jgi:hypothetical protein
MPHTKAEKDGAMTRRETDIVDKLIYASNANNCD